jgi:GTP-binding protein
LSFRAVLVGRPNVGKSTIFNRLVGRRRSLVHDLPGMTRDVLEETATLSSGRSFTLVDTGGFDPSERAEIPVAVRERALAEIARADLVMLVVDPTSGLMAADRDAAQVVRRAGRPCFVLANKIDRRDAQERESDAYALGFDEVFPVSAEHGLGFDELFDAIGARLPAEDDTAPPARSDEVAVAIIGRPNVGKSSLVNALLGFERSIVSEVAGTTRDATDAVIDVDGRKIRLIDTAGIRKKSKTEKGPEVLSVVAALKRLDRCDLAVLVVEARAGITSQDASIAREAIDRGRGLIVVANKWDMVEGDGASKAFEEHLASALPFARFAPLVRLSAKSGRNVKKLLPEIFRVAENRARRIPTAQLNRTLGEELRDRPPKGESKRQLKVYYVSQTGWRPPIFTIIASRAEPLYFSDSRRLENLLRAAEDFSGTPIVFKVAGRSGRSR